MGNQKNVVLLLHPDLTGVSILFLLISYLCSSLQWIWILNQTSTKTKALIFCYISISVVIYSWAVTYLTFLIWYANMLCLTHLICTLFAKQQRWIEHTVCRAIERVIQRKEEMEKDWALGAGYGTILIYLYHL